MRTLELLKLMGDMGVIYSEDRLPEIVDYCAYMLRDSRIMMINEEGKPCAFIFFSITDDPEKFLKKAEYEYRPHDHWGKMVYVEKLVSFIWNRDLRVIFERMIIEKYPQIECGVWHRARKHGDSKVISKRRIACTK